MKRGVKGFLYVLDEFYMSPFSVLWSQGREAVERDNRLRVTEGAEGETTVSQRRTPCRINPLDVVEQQGRGRRYMTKCGK